jgi:23S rRNA (uracil1939-C5)-methyltransferase
LAGSDTLEERWMGESFPIRPGAFLQVNREGARVLHGLVLAALDAQPKDTVVDAYCGMGFYGRAIARLGAQVIGLELDAEAVAMGEARPVPRLLLEAGAVEALLAKHLPADRVILNPPRGGIEVQVVEALLKAPPRRLVYVSCDPATLARDLGRLAPAFRIRQIQLVDLFPQTAHVETVVTLDALDA